MQRTGSNGRIVFFILLFATFALSILFDQLTKIYFRNNYSSANVNSVIDGFLYFSLLSSGNSGIAYGLFSDSKWLQPLLKFATPLVVILFGLYLFFAIKKEYKFLSFALVLLMGGAIGNYIDRVASGAVTDFIIIRIGNVEPFGCFNLADVFLSIGMVMLVLHLLFIDKNAVFKFKNEKS